MRGSSLKCGVRSAHFTSSHASSSCAHVVCLILRDSPFLFLLSIFSPIVLFIHLVFSFFHDSAADVTLMKCWRQLPESRVRSVQVASQIHESLSAEAVVSTRMSHKAKRERAQPRIAAPECADAMRVSEHFASTPCTRTQRLMINRMMSKCRTRQLESCDTSSAFFHDWLERGVWTEPPTEFRLDDGRWQPVKALELPSGVSVRWSSGNTHMTTNAKHVENLAGLSEVKSSTPKLLTAAMSRRYGSRFVPRIERARAPPGCEAKKCTDITVPACQEHMQVVTSCKTQEEINMDQEAR